MLAIEANPPVPGYLMMDWKEHTIGSQVFYLRPGAPQARDAPHCSSLNNLRDLLVLLPVLPFQWTLQAKDTDQPEKGSLNEVLFTCQHEGKFPFYSFMLNGPDTSTN